MPALWPHQTLDPKMSQPTTNIISVDSDMKVRQAQKLGIGLPDKCEPLLLTFELGENLLLWTATPRNRKRSKPVFRGAVELGYGDVDGLAEWFEHFRKRAGEFNHEIRLMISGPEIVQRCLMVPVVPKSELPSIVKSQAKKVYPFEVGKGLYGWKIIDKVEWAGGPKYEIFVQALDEHWRDWLPKLFGNLYSNMALITSSGQVLENLLGATAEGFEDEDSYLIRLKANVLETALFHKGHLEFFREVPVDSVTDAGDFTDLRRLVGVEESRDRSVVSEQLLLDDVTSIIRDVLDYYHGQFGQRNVRTVYTCMPPRLSEKIGEYAEGAIGDRVVDLSEKSRIAEHSKLSGVTTEFQDYPQWMAAYPIRKIPPSIVNLLPEQIRRRKKERMQFRYSLIVLFLATMGLISISVFKSFSNRVLRVSVNEYRAIAGDAVSDSLLTVLSGYEERVTALQRNVSLASGRENLSFVIPLRILSQLSRDDVRLNSVDISPIAPGEIELKIEGEVIGPKERQEAEFYTYLTDLEKHPAVKEINLMNKNVVNQQGSSQLRFLLQIVVH
jgi:hypothetical protein